MPVAIPLARGIESAEDRVKALLRRKQQLLAPPEPSCIYACNFHKFLLDKVWTKDESRGGRVAKLPPDPYFKDFCDDLVTENRLFIEKSRRVRASWVVCAFDLWVAAGGMDSRWPALMLSKANRQVVITAQARDPMTIGTASWFLNERVGFIYRELEKRNIWQHWPDFPTFKFNHAQARGSNGGLIDALPEGEHKARGGGVTLLHNEEVATWQRAKGTLAAQNPCVMGGGHIIIVTTPQVGSYCADIRNGKASGF